MGAPAKQAPPLPRIDRHIPAPTGRATASRYPFANMDVGSSFFAAGVPAHRVSSSAWHWAKRNAGNRKFIVRTVTENGVTGARVWRIA